MCSIGEVYRKQSKLDETMDYYSRGLNVSLLHGPDHPVVADIYTTIGDMLLCDQSKYPEALEMFNKSLGIKIKVFGHKHLGTANTQNDIAAVHLLQGNLQGALQAENEVLQTRIELLGVDHPTLPWPKQALSMSLKRLSVMSPGGGGTRIVMLQFKRQSSSRPKVSCITATNIC